MLRTIQIITLIQGIFILIPLIKNKKEYLKPTLYLLIGSVVSVILYIFGDDDSNLISHNVDIFLFDKSLFITFLFLFVKYYLSKSESFSNKDILYFIPNILFCIIELLEIIYSDGIFIIDCVEILVELTFLTYMIVTLISLTKTKSQSWMLYFIVPLVILIASSIIEEILWWFKVQNTVFSKASDHLGEYTIIVVALLFYTIAFKLIMSPSDILIKNTPVKYKSSSLTHEQILTLKEQLVKLMEEDQLYKDSKLSLQKIASLLNVPRQYISEALNLHMKTSFQDFVNQYRVEAFINCLNNSNYNQYTLLGIAEDVGFNSKTSFNTAFKKFKNVTPSEFKQSLKKEVKRSSE